jgi:hypothetical protein
MEFMRIRLLLTLLLFLGAFVLGAADLTGKWSGTIVVVSDGETTPLPILLILKQDGNKLSGTAGADESTQRNITKATVDGDKVTIEFMDESTPYHFDLNVDGDQMTGEAHSGDSPKMKMSLKRVS